jgi:hypothetical protein
MVALILVLAVVVVIAGRMCWRSTAWCGTATGPRDRSTTTARATASPTTTRRFPNGSP